MAKQRKRTKGLKADLCMPEAYKEPTPQQRVERATEHVLREALEADPKFKGTAKAIARQIRLGASKLVRGAGTRGGHE